MQQAANSNTGMTKQAICNIIFYITLFVLEVFLVGFFGLIKYPDSSYGTVDSNQSMDFQSHVLLFQQMLMDINIYMLVGYSFLIAYLRFHRWSSLGFSFFSCAITVQIYILFSAFWNRSWKGNWGTNYQITILEVIGAQKAAVAILISLGALMGKVDLFQILILCFVEMLFYTLNEGILFYAILIRDIGGSFYIHVFASFFGSAASWIYSPKANSLENPNTQGSYSSSTLSFLGTFMIWIFFPSFNSVNPLHLNQYNNIRYISMANTFWALAASTSSAFVMSSLLKNGKFSIEDIQNATLAGGIMIAATADMYAFPFPSLIVGVIAGSMSCASFHFLPKLLVNIKYFDTRGILYLHGIPGIFAAVISSITCATLGQNYFGTGSMISNTMLFDRSPVTQGGYQFAGMLISLLMGCASGAVMGFILRIWRLLDLPVDTFGDHIWWKMIQLTNPEPYVQNVKDVATVVANPRGIGEVIEIPVRSRKLKIE